ncbi:MAG: hypothetical protein AAGI11_08800 [Pseudomonadota bacterium]
MTPHTSTYRRPTPYSPISHLIKLLALATGLMLGFVVPVAKACTILSGMDENGVVWYGGNEDFSFQPDTRMTVVPRGEGRAGMVLFAYRDGFPQAGITEHGLAFDFNALAAGPLPEDDDWLSRPLLTNPLEFMAVLQTATTVDALVAYMEQYRIPGFNRSQLHLADAKGNLAIYTTGAYCESSGALVSTNFRICDKDVQQQIADRPVDRWRYDTAEKLMVPNEVDFDDIRQGLAATARPVFYSTIYSFIANLQSGEFTLYYGADFEKGVSFTVSELVDQGPSSRLMRELLPELPLSQFTERYEASGAEAAIAYLDAATDITPQLRQEILRMTYSGLVTEPDVTRMNLSAAKRFFEEWMKGSTNGTEDFYKGLFALVEGDLKTARRELSLAAENDALYTRFREKSEAAIRRMDGEQPVAANRTLSLPGHRDASSVFVHGPSPYYYILNFMTRTEDGWEGEFEFSEETTEDYVFVVDGNTVIKPEKVVANAARSDAMAAATSAN